MKANIAVLFPSLLISSCVTSNVNTYAPIDKSAKSITVPAGSAGLKGELKKILSANGWQMKVYGGPEVIQGTSGETTDLRRFDTFSTRYNLVMQSSQFDLCLNFEPMINYEVVVIDNQTGAEVITIDGTGCEGSVARKFAEALTS